MKLFAIEHKTVKRPYAETAATNALDAWMQFIAMEANGDLREACIKLAQEQGYQLVEVNIAQGQRGAMISGPTGQITFDRTKLNRFKVSYANAVERKFVSFIFEDNEWLVGYAKYVIEYLEGKIAS